MNRKQTTRFLSDVLLRDRFHFPGEDRVYWAGEVSLGNTLSDCDAGRSVRIDFLQFEPVNHSQSGLEHGVFTGYEVKSCVADFDSPNGHNPVGDRNWRVWKLREVKRAAQVNRPSRARPPLRQRGRPRIGAR